VAPRACCSLERHATATRHPAQPRPTAPLTTNSRIPTGAAVAGLTFAPDEGRGTGPRATGDSEKERGVAIEGGAEQTLSGREGGKIFK
jgi:hypothetical protein